MIKRSLFVRVFGWSWACMTLVVVANLVALLMDEPEEFKAAHRARTASLLTVFAEEESLDLPDGAAWLDKVKQSMNMEVFVFDSSGRARRGSPPGPAAELAARAAATGLPAHLDAPARYYWLAVPGKPGADGSRSTAVGLVRMPPPPSGFEIFFGRGPVVPRLVALFLLSGVLSLLLARSLSAPLRKLGDTARQLAAGDLAARVPPGPRERGDEIAELAADVNLMAERLEEAMDLAATTVDRHLPRVAFAARAPERRPGIGADPHRRSGRARAGSDRNGDQPHGHTDRPDPLPLTARGRGTAAHLDGVRPRRPRGTDRARRRFRGSRGEPRCRTGGGRTLRISGNEELLARAVENVVRNAVRYTLEGSTVSVSLSREAGTTLIRVRDHGPGVPPEALEKIFKPFYRVESARDRNTGGTGLGLAIGRRAVRIHGGSIAARNHPEGGLEVEIRLPAAHL